ncbi:MAG: ABC transporter permease [Anaerolineae bacterium]|nr:ABC transporter permease [Anaerolineae bacterium]
MTAENGAFSSQMNAAQRIKRIYRTHSKSIIPFLIAAILLIAGEFVAQGFAGAAHVLELLKISSFLGILVLAQSIVIIAGGEGIDLSVGAIATISAVMASVIINGQDKMIWVALPAVIVTGFVLGLFNGIGVALFRVPPLIMTLGMSSVINGMVIIYSQGYIFRGSASELLKTIGAKASGGIPNMVFVWAVVIAAALLILNRTRWGVMLYGVGANELTAELNGVKTRRVRALAYAFSGAISAIAGFFLLGYIGMAFIDIGSKYVLPCVAAAVIGGVSLAGGAGGYLGAAGGAIVLTVLSGLLVTIKMGEAGRQVVSGLVLIILLAVYARQSQR